MPCRVRGGSEPASRRPCRGALLSAPVRDHGFLPSLLLASRVQDVACGAIRIRAARRGSGATGTAMVGLASPSSSRALRRSAGRPLAAPTWLFLEPRRLVLVA